jgi:hypothetical protein
VAILAIVLPPLTLLPQIHSATDAVRARNALTFEALPLTAFQWTPSERPPDFLTDAGSTPTTAFVKIAAAIGLDGMEDDWQRSLAIARHLLTTAPTLNGGAVQDSLEVTYSRITREGDGYCADFVRVFEAIAGAAGMPMRAWAFSFDGFGGHGHVLVEVWNRRLHAWQMLDLFNNVYFVNEVGRPLSALQLRERLVRGGPLPQVMAIAPDARPGYRIESKLWQYYRDGQDEWYLWWGSNPFSHERAPLVAALAPWSRGASQLAAIAIGQQPEPRAIATPSNEPQRHRIAWLRWQLAGVAAVMLIGVLALPFVGQRAPRSTAPAPPRHAH